ncbi:MAG: hypothetical protein O3C40_04440 [Planctomycetota bacterium]|nr:hypothetical protein [Planctomycetota bacterium]
MKRSLTSATTWFVILAAFASPAAAHYLWVTIDAETGEHGTANIYFEGGPGPGDGQYLDRFIKNGKTWIRTSGASKPTELKVDDIKKDDKRWLSAGLTAAGPRSIDSYGKFGVYRYGETDVLLHYYAKNLDIDDHDDLHELGRAEQLMLDIVPHDEEDAMQLTVLWQGKPAAGRTLSIRGPGGFKENLTTDASGRVRFEAKAKGQYIFRTNVEEKKDGTDDGETFQLIRHHGTLIMNLPL